MESWFWYLKSVASWPCDAFCAFYQNGAQVKFEANPHFFCIPEICILCFENHLLPLYTLLKGFEKNWMIFMTPLPPNWEVSAGSSYLFISLGLLWNGNFDTCFFFSLFQSTSSNVPPAITSWRRMTCGCLELPQTQAAPKVSHWWLPLTLSCVCGRCFLFSWPSNHPVQPPQSAV